MSQDTEGALAHCLARAREIQPDLQISSTLLIDEGLANDILIVNDEIVFRFAKNEYGKKSLAGEIQVLNAIRPHVSLTVPNLLYADQTCMVYPFLKGVPLTRTVLASLSEPEWQAVSGQLADFLRQLNHVPLDESLPQTLAPVHYSDWVTIYSQVKEQVYPLLLKHQQAWAEELFGSMLGDEHNFDFTPRLIHGDLGCYHILFDPSTRSLSAVLDFGVAGSGDPANDLACLIQYYGEGFVQRFQGIYPEMDRLMLKRARFYAQAIEFWWILNGLQQRENFWFTAHLGNARDLK